MDPIVVTSATELSSSELQSNSLSIVRFIFESLTFLLTFVPLQIEDLTEPCSLTSAADSTAELLTSELPSTSDPSKVNRSCDHFNLFVLKSFDLIFAQVEDTTASCSLTTDAEPSTSDPFLVLKTWDFDGLQVEFIYKPKKCNSDSDVETEDGDDASTVALDETDTAEGRLNDVSELETQLLIEATVKVDQKLEPIVEEVPVNEEAEEQYEGAAGLWAQDYQLPCFAGPPVKQPVFQRVGHQQSADSLLEDVAQQWYMQHVIPPIQVVQPIMVNQCVVPPVSSTFDTLVKMSQEALISNKGDADCMVCKRKQDNERGVVLKDCVHVFCRRCLIHAINNNPNPVMMCPSKGCVGEVRDEEIKALLNPEAYEKYVLETLCKMNIFDVAELQENYEFVENKNKFDCAICLQIIKPGDGVVIKNCLHEYCKTCLGRYIQKSDSAIVPCPFRADDGARCIGFLMDSEIRSLVPIDTYLEFLTKSLDQAEATNANAFHCKTPDCPLWVEIDEFVAEFTCPRCNRENCIQCKAVHQGTSCDNYQEMVHGPDRRSRENVLTANQVRGLIAEKEAQPCPHCGILVERIDGCRHMTCTKCRFEFEWQLL